MQLDPKALKNLTKEARRKYSNPQVREGIVLIDYFVVCEGWGSSVYYFVVYRLYWWRWLDRFRSNLEKLRWKESLHLLTVHQVLTAHMLPLRFIPSTSGYPLIALSVPCQEPLLSVIHSSPTLAQEAIFRHCLDTLLTEVRGGQPSYGTRVILQLLINCKPNTCIECTQKVCVCVYLCVWV